jgi:hypothetical protein
MGFSGKQLRALRRDLNVKSIRTRQANGRELCYIEGWHAIAEANRIFGFDGWDRETVESRCLMTRETRGIFLAVYAAKVRVTVRANGKTVVREGHGSGEGRGTSPGETHDIALKGAETDATKRALATFGKPFGLSLYLGGRRNGAAPDRSQAAPAERTRKEPPPHSENRVADAEPAQVALKPGNESRDVPAATARIDKSVLTFGAPRRHRDREHLKFVAMQACLLCGRTPSDPHHLRFAQPQALGLKVSDEFTVPLCRTHHRQLHHAGNEVAWWRDMSIDALEIARGLWQESHPKLASKERDPGGELLGVGPANDAEGGQSGRGPGEVSPANAVHRPNSAATIGRR